MEYLWMQLGEVDVIVCEIFVGFLEIGLVFMNI